MAPGISIRGMSPIRRAPPIKPVSEVTASIISSPAGRERRAGAGEPAELGLAVREAAGVAGTAAALPQRAHLRLVRRPAARGAQHRGRRSVPPLAAGEFAVHRSIAHGAGGRVSRVGDTKP